MKFLTSAVGILLLCLIHHHAMGQSYFRNDYPKVWQRAADYTLEVAEAMPANQWGFRPTPESMTFHEQLAHLVQNLSFLSGRITAEQPDFFKGKDPQTLSKQELTQLLKDAFAHVGRLASTVEDQTLRETVAFGGEKMPKENIFYLMRDHATHHRAQAILYLRMKGLEAPRYRGW